MRLMRASTSLRPCVTFAFVLLAAVVGPGRLTAAPGDTAVTPGEFVVERPSLINLGFEWHIDGDANRNASVEVSFRKQGETAWRKGMPLVRLQGEHVYQRNVFNLVVPNMFAGSILDLEPDTAYEARFELADPDGIAGPAADATKTVTVRTRPEPMPAQGGTVYHVYPTKWKGPKLEPAFEGIMCAYNYYCGAGDTAPGGRPRVKPGDTILVHAGTYAYHYEFYIEMDGSMHNVRVMRNMLINSASHPMSTQPSTGGPIYFIRNIAYHAPGGSTRLTAGSPGVLFYNNTILTETSGGASANVHWRNNLILGSNALAAIFNVNTNTSYSSSDYNGFRPNGGDDAFQWNAPPSNMPLIRADGSSEAKIEPRRFATLDAYSQATSQDRHSVLVDYDIFVNVPKLDEKDLAAVQRLYRAEDLDFRLKPGSAAVNRGVELPNVPDGFTGQAPDLGALEAGQPLPIYGPRPR
jgi:hypothetical protein